VAPNRPEVYYLLGRAYDAAGPLQNAIRQQFGRYLDTGTVDPWAEYCYGRVLARQAEQGAPADLAEAQRHLERAITLDDRLAEAHSGLGDVLEMRGQLEAARGQLERAVQLDPKYSPAFYKLGQIYPRLGQQEKARQAAAAFQRLKAEERKDLDREQVQRFLERVRR
jgi:superkiller protein 3